MADSIWDGLRGHAGVIDLFRRAAGRGRVDGALLFAGPPGVGKRTFADRLAKALLCPVVPDADLDACGTCPSCRAFAVHSHPDFTAVAVPEGKREIPLAAVVGEADARGRSGLTYDLSRKPSLSRRRVAVIDGADALRTEAANALLKTLEEPPPGAVLILTASRPESLLPTIRSRCRTVRFAPLAEGDVAALLVGGEVSEADAADAARLSGGSLTTAARLLDPDLRALRGDVAKHLSPPVNRPVAAKALAARVEGLGSDPAGKREAAGWLFTFAVDRLRADLSAAAAAGDAAAADRAAEKMERVADAEARLARYSPVPAVVEGLVHELG